MKHIFLALLCITIGFTAAANNFAPRQSTSTTTVLNSSISIGDNKQTNNPSNLFRQEMVYKFTDACGVRVYIHVFAPNGTSVTTMHLAAMQHFQNGTWTSNGCYENH